MNYFILAFSLVYGWHKSQTLNVINNILYIISYIISYVVSSFIISYIMSYSIYHILCHHMTSNVRVLYGMRSYVILHHKTQNLSFSITLTYDPCYYEIFLNNNLNFSYLGIHLRFVSCTVRVKKSIFMHWRKWVTNCDLVLKINKLIHALEKTGHNL